MKKKLCTADKWIVYGAGHIGRRLADNLIEQGFKVAMFIDNSNTYIPPYLNIPIVKLSDFKIKELFDCIVVLSVNDVFSHDSLAKNLRDFGFSKLLYKTQLICFERDFPNNELYDDLLNNYDIVEREIDFSEPQILDYHNTFHHLKNGKILFKASIDRLFVKTTYHSEPVSFYDFHPFVKLYTSMWRDKQLDCAEFIEHYKKTRLEPEAVHSKDELKRVIDGRISIYTQMVAALEFDYDFFDRHPVEVYFDDDISELIIKDGLNRAGFLYSRGIKHISCSSSEQDYEKIRRRYRNELDK